MMAVVFAAALAWRWPVGLSGTQGQRSGERAAGADVALTPRPPTIGYPVDVFSTRSAPAVRGAGQSGPASRRTSWLNRQASAARGRLLNITYAGPASMASAS